MKNLKTERIGENIIQKVMQFRILEDSISYLYMRYK